MANYFEQFEPPAPPANYFAQYGDGAEAPASGPQTPWWFNAAAGGMYPAGLADKIQAGAAALKENMSGGLDFSKAYDQALTQYQQQRADQENAHPTGTAVAKAAGSVPPLLLGGEAVNAGLEGLGPAGRFLAGQVNTPSVARTAGGAFRALTGTEKAVNTLAPAAARTVQMAREGAQAGAYGAANSPDGDIAQGAGYGALAGAGFGALAVPAIAGLGKVAQIPAGAAAYLPHWAQGAVGVIGGEKLLEHGPQLAAAMAAHPIAGTATATGAGLLGASAFLAAHPQLRDLVTRMGLMGYAAAPPSAGTAPQ